MCHPVCTVLEAQTKIKIKMVRIKTTVHRPGHGASSKKKMYWILRQANPIPGLYAISLPPKVITNNLTNPGPI